MVESLKTNLNNKILVFFLLFLFVLALFLIIFYKGSLFDKEKGGGNKDNGSIGFFNHSGNASNGTLTNVNNTRNDSDNQILTFNITTSTELEKYENEFNPAGKAEKPFSSHLREYSEGLEDSPAGVAEPPLQEEEKRESDGMNPGGEAEAPLG